MDAHDVLRPVLPELVHGQVLLQVEHRHEVGLPDVAVCPMPDDIAETQSGDLVPLRLVYGQH